MIRSLSAVIVVLILILSLTAWRADRLSTDLERAQEAAAKSQEQVKSLRTVLTRQRELAKEQAATETNYLTEVKDAQDEAERLRTCLADGSCGLRIAATCPGVRVGRAAAAASEPDAETPRLTTVAQRSYSALVAGIKTQRAQIAGLQEQLITLHSKCKIGG